MPPRTRSAQKAERATSEDYEKRIAILNRTVSSQKSIIQRLFKMQAMYQKMGDTHLEINEMCQEHVSFLRMFLRA